MKPDCILTVGTRLSGVLLFVLVLLVVTTAAQLIPGGKLEPLGLTTGGNITH